MKQRTITHSNNRPTKTRKTITTPTNTTEHTINPHKPSQHKTTGGLEVKSVVEIPKFEMGDMVEVIEGGFTAMQGRVINIDGTRITVKPSHKEFDTLVFEAYTLKKFFKIGTCVVVLVGCSRLLDFFVRFFMSKFCCCKCEDFNETYIFTFNSNTQTHTGDHVRVLRGKHERETGSILSVEENLITVLSDVSTSEVVMIMIFVVLMMIL